jgi:hypothetical protein
VSEHIEGSALHVGLLSLNAKKLLSPESSQPGLFSVPFTDLAGSNIETQAKLAVGEGIASSSFYCLAPSVDGIHRGYLLREAGEIDLQQHALTAFSTHQVAEFIQGHTPHDITGYFLRQIIKYMA